MDQLVKKTRAFPHQLPQPLLSCFRPILGTGTHEESCHQWLSSYTLGKIFGGQIRGFLIENPSYGANSTESTSLISFSRMFHSLPGQFPYQSEECTSFGYRRTCSILFLFQIEPVCKQTDRKSEVSQNNQSTCCLIDERRHCWWEAVWWGYCTSFPRTNVMLPW